MKRALLAAVLMLAAAGPALAWDGIDTDSGASVTIERGNLVRSGETIEIYDWDAGDYPSIDVDDINRFGGSVEIEGYDADSGDYVTFEMDD